MSQASSEISQPFSTLQLHQAFSNPSNTGSDIPPLHSLIRPHIDSFNSIFDAGLLDLAVQDIVPRDIYDSSGNTLKFWFEDLSFQRPLLPDKLALISTDPLLMPRECRERGITYQSKLTGRICWTINGSAQFKGETRSFGYVPIMVRSTRCHLESLSAAQLAKAKEEAEELGGYFIVNGVEKLIRLLVVPRRNYPLALKRPTLASRGPLYTEFGVQIRCVRPDQSSQTLTLHYLSDGNLMVRFSYRKSEYLVPLVLLLKSLMDGVTDRAIYSQIVQHETDNTFLTGRVEMMLRTFRSTGKNLRTQRDCLEFLGARFRPAFTESEQASDVEVGNLLLRSIILVHLVDNADKFNLFVFMARKLYALVAGQTIPDSVDALQHQEILLSGHLYLGYLKERLDSALSALKSQISTDLRKDPESRISFLDESYFKRILQKATFDVGKHMQFFIATGNLNTRTGMDLQQVTGYTVVAERLNFLRFLSHFRSYHRGAFFTTMKNTDIRKLRPEQWGFACPVHTPDGPSCGLLSHLTYSCQLVTRMPENHPALLKRIVSLLVSLGATPYVPGVTVAQGNHPVLLDGRWVALVNQNQIEQLAQNLRLLRCRNQTLELQNVEIAAIPVTLSGTFPGLFLFTTPSRMLRPVQLISNDVTDYIGTLEQLHMNIALSAETATSLHSYHELAPERILSIVAGITPFSNYNQSPRNMYQCQMAKQTIGTPLDSYSHRADSKLYRLYTGQAPIVRPRLYNSYALDSYPNGTNAVVAVISYTSYDMEDAMILNKSSFERGFANAAVYKSEFYDLSLRRRHGEKVSFQFAGSSDDEQTFLIDLDGLPQPGQWVRPGDPVVRYVDVVDGTVRYERWTDFEPAIIDQVRILSNEVETDKTNRMPLQRVHVTFRIPRSPVVGDKFASRHGQKGVCSQRYPMIDMPFSEHGITPDIIINPHAFPSRMTIGMLLESMAGKSGAMKGMQQDATPFLAGQTAESEKDGSDSLSLSDYFGSQLLEQGFNYHGNEPLYSGITGEPLRADIYIGVVYYQRLRHMVGDKFQVRTTGPVHDLTRQPIKGRQRAGGIRFGEMERDSLLAHGASFLLQDRLVNCSDYSHAYCCTQCNSLLSTELVNSKHARKTPETRDQSVLCRMCNSSANIRPVAIPFVFRYLAVELQAMNIAIRVHIS